MKCNICSISSHARTAAVYENCDEARDGIAVQNRRDAVRLAEIRSGYCRAFRAYHRLSSENVVEECNPVTVTDRLFYRPNMSVLWLGH